MNSFSRVISEEIVSEKFKRSIAYSLKHVDYKQLTLFSIPRLWNRTRKNRKRHLQGIRGKVKRSTFVRFLRDSCQVRTPRGSYRICNCFNLLPVEGRRRLKISSERNLVFPADSNFYVPKLLFNLLSRQTVTTKPMLRGAMLVLWIRGAVYNVHAHQYVYIRT